MGLTVDGVGDGAINTLSGKLVTSSTQATGAPTGTGINALFTGLNPMQLHKVRVTYAALTDADTEQTLVLWSLPAGFVVQRVIVEIVTLFAGTFNDLDMVIGVAGTTNKFIASCDMETAAIISGDVIAEVGAGLTDATLADVAVTSNEFVAVDVIATVTAGSSTLSTATAGVADIYIMGWQLPLN